MLVMSVLSIASIATPLLATTPTEDGSGVPVLVIVVAGAVLAWLLSLLFHPYRACRSCGGTPRVYGAVATKSFRMCPHCGGTGRRRRVGATLWERNR
jgi:hypothetical protein